MMILTMFCYYFVIYCYDYFIILLLFISLPSFLILVIFFHTVTQALNFHSILVNRVYVPISCTTFLICVFDL